MNTEHRVDYFPLGGFSSTLNKLNVTRWGLQLSDTVQRASIGGFNIYKHKFNTNWLWKCGDSLRMADRTKGGKPRGGRPPYLAAMWHFTVAHIQCQSYTYVHPYAWTPSDFQPFPECSRLNLCSEQGAYICNFNATINCMLKCVRVV